MNDPQKHIEVTQQAGCVPRPCSALSRTDACSRAYRMTYDEITALLKRNGWSNRGDWDNWFHPQTGWNYSRHYAAVNILMYPPNNKVSDASDAFAAPLGSSVRSTTYKQSAEK